eukprot:gene28422-26111_t
MFLSASRSFFVAIGVAMAAPSSGLEMVSTPGGMRPKECVLELKSGATILEADDRDGVA